MLKLMFCMFLKLMFCMLLQAPSAACLQRGGEGAGGAAAFIPAMAQPRSLSKSGGAGRASRAREEAMPCLFLNVLKKKEMINPNSKIENKKPAMFHDESNLKF